MQTSAEQHQQDEICCPGLPLAVYREIAAHLRQVLGVETGLIAQHSQQFDYNKSQVGGLWIRYPQANSLARERVEQILAYYGDRYGAWEKLNSQVISFESNFSGRG